MKTDAQFVRDFHDSRRWVTRAAWWLAGFADVRVTIPEPVLRPDARERARYADGGDLIVRERGALKVAEVKHRSVDFTGRHDYPFATVFVNEAYKLTPDRLARLWGYVIFNRAGTAVAVVRPSTSPFWVSERRHDPAQRRDCEFLACPVSLAEFHTFPDP